MKRILLADDEPASNDIIRHYIRQYDLPLSVIGEAESGDAALELIQTLSPDIIFLDIQMPVLNGLDVMRAVRESARHQPAFIIITAHAHFEYAQRALQLAAADIILKPLRYEQFCTALSRLLGYRYSDNPLFNRLLEHIHQYWSQPLTLKSCAEAVGTTPSNIVKLFGTWSPGLSFVQYCNQLRIKKACALLDNGREIKEVSEVSGFQHLNYFYRIFKKIKGITPKEYVFRQSLQHVQHVK